MATETAAYAQLKALAERFIGSQSDNGDEQYVSPQQMARDVLNGFFKFVEEDEIDRLKMELTQARADAATLADEVSRLTVERNELHQKLTDFNAI